MWADNEVRVHGSGKKEPSPPLALRPASGFRDRTGVTRTLRQRGTLDVAALTLAPAPLGALGAKPRVEGGTLALLFPGLGAFARFGCASLRARCLGPKSIDTACERVDTVECVARERRLHAHQERVPRDVRDLLVGPSVILAHARDLTTVRKPVS
jgi:hypothetical protein